MGKGRMDAQCMGGSSGCRRGVGWCPHLCWKKGILEVYGGSVRYWRARGAHCCLSPDESFLIPLETSSSYLPTFPKKPTFSVIPFQPTGVLLQPLQDACFAISGKDSVPVLLRNRESACSREGGGGEEISFCDESSHTSCCFCFGHTGLEAVGCFLPGF